MDKINDNQGEISYSTTEMLKQLREYDHTVEVIGWIDTLIGMARNFNKSETLIYKFIINNSDGERIVIIGWNDEAIRMEKLMLRSNDIVHIDGASVRPITNMKFKFGTQMYELCVQSNTKITKLGEKKFQLPADPTEIPLVDFKTISKTTTVVRLKAWIKKTCILLVDRFGVAADIPYGTVPDGEFILNVKIRSYDKDHKFVRGQRIELIGMLQRNGSEVSFFVETMDDIRRLDEPELPLQKLILALKMIE